MQQILKAGILKILYIFGKLSSRSGFNPKKYEHYVSSSRYKYSAFENCVNLEEQIREGGVGEGGSCRGQGSLTVEDKNNVTCCLMWYVWQCMQYERWGLFFYTCCSAHLPFQNNLLLKAACLQIMKYSLSIRQIICLMKNTLF